MVPSDTRGAQGTTTFRGASGLERLWGDRPVVVPDPSDYRARHRRVSIDGIDVDSLHTTPVAVVETSEPVRRARGEIVVVIAGSYRYRHGGEHHEGAPGTVHLLRLDGRLDFEVDEPAHLIRVSVPLGRVPPELRRSGVAVRPVPSDLLCRSFAAFIRQLSRPEAPEAIESARLARATYELIGGLLEEARSPAPDGELAQELRPRIVAHIRANLHDPLLGPRSIAERFGISLRWLHQVFDVDGDTVARHIRQRRLDAVAAELRRSAPPQGLAALAGRHGFASRDQLARAFRARYGMTVQTYRDLAVAGSVLPEPGGGVVLGE